ncbi:hypothetical protein [uncultured Campylobacter sp.]|uniref:hypothetical protein n=1 Tax=uncultured Campylobacter sp. TaxID=218934 RepID=UPI00260C962A|nr:hypothetical protein [uncultured Campylobacter sp.]
MTWLRLWTSWKTGCASKFKILKSGKSKCLPGLMIKAAPRNFKFSRFAQVLAAKFALRFKFTFRVAAFNLAFASGAKFLNLRPHGQSGGI